MSLNLDTPFAVYRAHLELYFRLDNLLRTAGLRLMTAASHAISSEGDDRGTWAAAANEANEPAKAEIASGDALQGLPATVLTGPIEFAAGVTGALVQWRQDVDTIVKGALEAPENEAGPAGQGRAAA